MCKKDEFWFKVFLKSCECIWANQKGNWMTNIIRVKFEATPLGQLNVTWIIPNVLLSNLESFILEVPGYKYDLPRFASIPVPFSSNSFELKTTNIKFSTPIIEINEESGLYSNKLIHVSLHNTSLITEYATLSYSIPNIVNNDGIYFVLVYPFRSPFEGIPHHIELNAKFTFNIRKFKFWERYFTYPSNAKLVHDEEFASNRNGDEIMVCGEYSPVSNQTLDLHLTATRFPIFIRRDKFWITIFLIFILVGLSPYIVFIIDKILK